MHCRCRGRDVDFGCVSCFVLHTQQGTRPLPALQMGVAGLLLPFSCCVVPLWLDVELKLPTPASHSGTLCLVGPVRVSVIRVQPKILWS